jgi:hypothetical protein
MAWYTLGAGAPATNQTASTLVGWLRPPAVSSAAARGPATLRRGEGILFSACPGPYSVLDRRSGVGRQLALRSTRRRATPLGPSCAAGNLAQTRGARLECSRKRGSSPPASAPLPIRATTTIPVSVRTIETFSGAETDGGPDAGPPLCLIQMGDGSEFNQYNQLAIAGACAPGGFSGRARVKHIERYDYGDVRRIDLVLDTNGICDPDVPAELAIWRSRVSWGLEVGSELRVSTFAKNEQRIDRLDRRRLGAVVSQPDGSLLAAFFEQTSEFLPAFLDQLPFGVMFQSECAMEPGKYFGYPCHRSTIRESLTLSTGTILQESRAATIAVSGGTFYVSLHYARNNFGSTGACPSRHAAAEGQSYHFHALRLP